MTLVPVVSENPVQLKLLHLPDSVDSLPTMNCVLASIIQPSSLPSDRASHFRLRSSLSAINSTSSAVLLTRADICVPQIASFGSGCRGFGLIGVQLY